MSIFNISEGVLLINEVVRVTLEVKVTFLAANELSQMLEVCVRLKSLMP